MRFFKNAADFPHGLLAFCLQLGSSAINHGRDLFHLLGCQIQFCPQMSLHVLGYRSVMWMTKHPARAVKRPEEPAGNPGEENEDEGEESGSFPLRQRVKLSSGAKKAGFRCASGFFNFSSSSAGP